MPPAGRPRATTPRTTSRTTTTRGELTPSFIGGPFDFAQQLSHERLSRDQILSHERVQTQGNVGRVGLTGAIPAAGLEVGGGYRLFLVAPGEAGVPAGAPAPAAVGAGPEGGAGGNPPEQPQPVEPTPEQHPPQGPTPEQIQQLIQQAVAQEVANAVAPLNERINFLELRNRRLMAVARGRRAQVRELQARITELEAGGPPPPPPGENEDIFTPEQLTEHETQIAAARNNLIGLTIQRKRTSILTRWLRRQRQERTDYTAALANYNQLMDRLVVHRRAEMHRDHPEMSEEQIFEAQREFRANDSNELAQAEHDEHERRLQAEIDGGGIRGRWAQAKRFIANQPTWRKLVFGAGVPAAAIALISGTAGIGLAVLVAGGSIKFAVGMINANASIRNVAPAKLRREQSQITRAWERAQAHLAPLAVNERYAELSNIFGNSHRGNVRTAETLNSLGRVGQFAGGVILGLSAASVEIVPSILDAANGNGGKPEGQPGDETGPDGKPDGRPDGQPNSKPDGKPDGRPDGRPGPDGTPDGDKDKPVFDVAPGKATPEELAGLHYEPLPADGKGSVYSTTGSYLPEGFDFEYAGQDAQGNNIISIEDAHDNVIVKDAEFTRTGALSNHSIREAGLFRHGPNVYDWKNTPYDRLHGSVTDLSRRTISTLLLKDSDELSNSG